jgi:hypothetical protein
MSYSPDGQNLAFTVLDGNEESEIKISRLFVLQDDNSLRLVEQNDYFTLSAPAYSPDGKQLAYLRLPASDYLKIAESITEEAKKKKSKYGKRRWNGLKTTGIMSCLSLTAIRIP